MQTRIVTSGLKELAQMARKMDDKFITTSLKEAHAEVADEVIRRGKSIAGATSRRASVKAAESMRATKTAAYAAVRLGDKSKPWLIANNFGARHNMPRRGSGGRTVLGWNQFPLPGRGEFLYKALEQSGRDIEKTYSNSLQKLVDRTLT